jgi:hypothetical protein
MDYTTEEQYFINFLNSYSQFYRPAYVIAEDKFGETMLPVGDGQNEFRMYALDDICHSCEAFRQGDIAYTPKTTDAIWYKKVNGIFFIFLIEFKGDYLCRNSSKCTLVELAETLKIKNDEYENEFEDEIKKANWLLKKYSDKMLMGLATKPLETVTIAIPLIYEEYLRNNPEVMPIDIRNFLINSRIIYRVVSLAEDHEPNRQRTRGESYRCSNVIPSVCKRYARKRHDREPVASYESSLKNYHKRYEKAGIVYSADFVDNTEFNSFIDNYLR